MKRGTRIALLGLAVVPGLFVAFEAYAVVRAADRTPAIIAA